MKVSVITLVLGWLLVVHSSTAPEVPKDLAIRLTITACNGTSIADTFKGSYVRTGSGDELNWDVPVRLSGGETKKLDRLIVESSFFDLPPVLPDDNRQFGEPSPDDIGLTVRRAGVERTVAWHGPSLDFNKKTDSVWWNPGDTVRQKLNKLATDISKIFLAMASVKRIPKSGTICL